MVLQTKLHQLIQGDSFTLQKEFMVELEDLSNSTQFAPESVAKAKLLILKAMLKKEQVNLAQSYVKKCMMKFSGSDKFINKFLQGISKLTKNGLFGQSGIAFTLEIIKKAALDDVNPKVFTNLLNKV